MNNIQSKINSELRRPNAGKDALCNVVADVAQEIANNAGGGTSIPVLKVLRVEEFTVDGETYKEVIFDDASNEILDNLVGENAEVNTESSQGSITSRAVIMSTDSLSLLLPSDYGNYTGSLVGVAMLSAGYNEGTHLSYEYIFIQPIISIMRYVENPEQPEELLNRWFMD